MDIFSIVSILIAVIALGLAIFFMVKSAKKWGAIHVTTLFFLFFATWVFAYSSSAVVRYRVALIKKHDTEKTAVEELEERVAKLKHGDLIATGYDPGSLNAVLAAYGRLTLDRGRIWRGIRYQSAENNGASFSMIAPAAAPAPAAGGQAPPAAGAQPPAAAANADTGPITDKLVVYAFAEFQSEDGRILPGVFLGEFLVDSVQGDAIKLRPTDPLSPVQMQTISSGAAATWALFELMPLDSHEAYATQGSEKNQEQLFGRMDQAELAKLFQIDPSLTQNAEGIFPNGTETDPNLRKAALLRSYLLDGSRTADPLPPEFEWILVEFTKEHKEEVDSKDKGIATEGGFFDFEGRTVDSRIKRTDESTVTFRPGDRQVFWKLPAEDLIAKDVAKLIERFYVRPLNDYQFAFREIRERAVSARQGIDLYTRENAIIEATNKQGQEQIAFRQNERQLLDKDYAQFTKEKDVITAEVARLEKELEDVNLKIKETFKMIQDQHAQMIAAASGN